MTLLLLFRQLETPTTPTVPPVTALSVAAAGMTFKQLQDATIADRFKEGQREDVKAWLNGALAYLWAAGDWTFKTEVVSIGSTAGEIFASGVPGDLGSPVAIVTADGSGPLQAIEPAQLMRRYYGQVDAGDPVYYAAAESGIIFGPVPSSTRDDYALVYEKEPPYMTGDDEVPPIPVGFQYSLVFGAAWTGLLLQEDPGWQAMQAKFDTDIEVMKSKYQSTTADLWGQWPAYRGGEWAAYR